MRKTILLLCLCLTACMRQDFYHLDTFNEHGILQAVVEIPAGTNLKIEYNKELKQFLPDQKEGKDRSINFIGYPGNYGFIPSTFSDPEKGGDGDALDVLVLSESLPTATVINIIPIAVLKLIDKGEQDYKIIAVPANRDERTIDTETYQSFATNFKGAKKIIELWFVNYDTDQLIIQGWGDEQEAISEIKKLIESK